MRDEQIRHDSTLWIMIPNTFCNNLPRVRVPEFKLQNHFGAIRERMCGYKNARHTSRLMSVHPHPPSYIYIKKKKSHDLI